MKTNVKSNLISARQLISNPENWTQGTFARIKDGRITSALDSRAVCFCSLGAAIRCTPEYEDYLRVAEALELAADDMLGTYVEAVNDRYGHKYVLEMYDLAIANCED